MPKEDKLKGLVQIRMASDCIECPDKCDEPFCPQHKQHYHECPCLGPHNAEEEGYELVEVEGRLYGRKLPENERPEE